MKKNGTTILLVLILLTGISLLLYPTVSDFWNSFHQTQVISNYEKEVSKMDSNEYETYRQAALEYNANLLKKGNRFVYTKKETDEYNSILNINGIMGFIEIEKIHVNLPIYHGEDEAVLQIAIGHMQGSSLPVGGESTHCVLMGHRGLPSARLFTDLDQMVVGDTILLHILDQTLAYEVDQIRIVLPNELNSLNIEEGKDYLTLVTCTPYGVNSHRLLVRGHRVESKESINLRVSADAVQIEPILIASTIAVPMILILVLLTFVGNKKKGKRA